MENYHSKVIVDTCFHIHVELGPGLLESVYEQLIYYELNQQGFNVKRQYPISIVWQNMEIEKGFKADLIVEDSVLIEIKSVSKIEPVHKKQTLTYLRLTGLKLGLLVNFNKALIKDGITRVVNNL